MDRIISSAVVISATIAGVFLMIRSHWWARLWPNEQLTTFSTLVAIVLGLAVVIIFYHWVLSDR